jgi:hypothetical protein
MSGSSLIGGSGGGFAPRRRRDPTSIARTFDLGVDPLDIRGVQARSIDMLQHLAGLGADEVRCYPVSDSTHAARLEAIAALGALMREI